MLKCADNLMSYDDHKIWMSTRRGELVERDCNDTLTAFASQNLLIDLSNLRGSGGGYSTIIRAIGFKLASQQVTQNAP